MGRGEGGIGMATGSLPFVQTGSLEWQMFSLRLERLLKEHVNACVQHNTAYHYWVS